MYFFKKNLQYKKQSLLLKLNSKFYVLMNISFDGTVFQKVLKIYISDFKKYVFDEFSCYIKMNLYRSCTLLVLMIGN